MGEGEENLEKVVGDVLRDKKLRIAVAESCTGGLISHRITNIPGSSDYFDRGVIVYSNASKTQMLSVPKLIIESFGAVSYETAKAMAEGVKKTGGSDLGLAVTGIAGPGGGTPSKPVVLVFIGLASDKPTVVREFRFTGARGEIKDQASKEALKLVLELLSG
ncbi:MAG: nicotinamide-nucleotide amidohydrolase family protein [Thermoplasmata archaeon]|nr:MAG: nicotinamide-nucleotide amidohydrolase family protein [Thermoplasmata archaeon]